MPTKRNLEQIKQREFLKLAELAELAGVRYSTIKYYSELGLLPYEQRGDRLAKYYPRAEATRRLKEILKLRKQGKTLTDIISHFKGRGVKKEINLDIKGEKVSLQAHDEKSIAYMEWIIGLDNFKEVIAEVIIAIRKREGIKK